MTAKSEPQPTILPYVAIVIALAAIPFASIFIRYAQSASAGSLVIAAYRLSIAALIMTPPVLLRYRNVLRRLTRRDLAWAAVSGVFLGVHFATWISSLNYTSVMISVVLVTTSPLWVAIASALLLRERLGRATLVGLALAFGGGLLIAAGGEPEAAPVEPAAIYLASAWRGAGRSAGGRMWGNFLALAGAWTVAGYWMIGRRLRARLPVVVYTWLVYGIAALAVWLLVLAAGLPAFGYPAEAYLWFVLLAVVPQLLGHSMFNFALAHLSAVYVSVAALGEPVGATVLALVLLGEVPGPVQVIGAALVLAGIYFATREEQAA